MRLNYLACVLCLSAGCSGSAIVLDGGPEPDGSLPAGRLVLESAPSLTLVFGAESEIVVRYEESGAPASGVPLRFGLEGRANDSTLTELTVETDAQGRARASVIAGSVASVFRVRIDAERAASASVDVAVGDLGFGGLLVEAPYSGRREGAVRRVVEIGADLDCGSLRPGEGSRTMVFTSPSSAELVFPTLPVGPRYAVAARVEGSGGAVLARGCVDAIELVRDQQTRVSITIVDRPLTLAGDYDARVAVTSEPVIALVADVFTAAGETLVAAAGSPAALCLDALDRQLDPAGRAFLSTRRAALEASLAGDLDAAGEGPEVSLEIARSRLRERLSAITLAGPLGVGDTGATFAVESIELAPTSDPDGTPLALAAAGVGASTLELVAAARPADDAVGVESFAITLSLASLALATLDEDARQRGLAGGAALLEPGAGCGVLQAWVAAEPSLSCDGACARAACDAMLQALYGALGTYFAAVDAVLAVVRASGDLAAHDADGDLVPERLGVAAPWSGAWASDLDAGLPIELSIEAARAGP